MLNDVWNDSVIYAILCKLDSVDFFEARVLIHFFYFIYTIYKLARKRRTPEEIAELPEAIQILTPQQKLVHNILDDSGLKNVILTSRIIKAMETQIAKVKNLARKVMRGGGNGFRELVKK